MKKKPKSTPVDPRAILDAANHHDLTLCAETLYTFILICVDWVLHEIRAAHKHMIGITPDTVKQMALQHIGENKPARPYPSDWHMLADCYRNVTNWVWALVNRREAEFIIRRLQKDDTFRRDFFYGTNYAGTGISMIEVIDRLIYDVKTSYSLTLQREDVATYVYECFLLGDGFKRLLTFSYHSSVFSWLGVIARRAVIVRLEEDGMINVPRVLTAANTRLTLLSKNIDYCRHVIDTLVSDERMHTLLTMVYVERKKPQQIAPVLGLTLEECALAIKRADSYLRDCAVRSADNYDDVISCREGRVVMVTGDAAIDLMQWLSDKGAGGAMSSLLGMDMDAESSEQLAIRALAEIEAAMHMSEHESIVWHDKLLKVSSKEIAQRIGKTAPYVDVLYSRLRRRQGNAARAWAVKHGIITVQERDDIEHRIANNGHKGSRDNNSDRN